MAGAQPPSAAWRRYSSARASFVDRDVVWSKTVAARKAAAAFPAWAQASSSSKSFARRQRGPPGAPAPSLSKTCRLNKFGSARA